MLPKGEKLKSAKDCQGPCTRHPSPQVGSPHPQPEIQCPEELEWHQIFEKRELALLKDEYAKDNALFADMATTIEDWGKERSSTVRKLQANAKEGWDTLDFLFKCLNLDNRRQQEIQEIQTRKQRAMIANITAANKGLAESLIKAWSDKASLWELNTHLEELNG